MTTRPFLRRLIAGLIAVVAVGATAGPTLAATPDPAIPPAWPLDSALTYLWTSSAVPPSTIKSAVNAAAADANGSRKSRGPSFAYSSGAPNGISYGPSNPCGVNGLACFQRNPASRYWHLWFRENGHRYDWGTLSWCEMTGSPNGCFQAETITLDELGHVSGLDHHVNLPDNSDYGDAVVQANSHARPQAGWSASSFGRCDVATLQQAYGLATWSTPYSTCLDIPTTLLLTASPTATSTGRAVTFTATLRSAGAGLLAGNPMASRVVVLQQRSGSGWADLLTMPGGATAGSYVAAYAPKGSQAFRAVFRPAAEGGRAASSAAVSITVTCTVAPCPLSVGQADQ